MVVTVVVVGVGFEDERDGLPSEVHEFYIHDLNLPYFVSAPLLSTYLARRWKEHDVAVSCNNRSRFLVID